MDQRDISFLGLDEREKRHRRLMPPTHCRCEQLPRKNVDMALSQSLGPVGCVPLFVDKSKRQWAMRILFEGRRPPGARLAMLNCSSSVGP